MTIRTKEQYESDLRLLKRLKKPSELRIVDEKFASDKYIIHISTIDRLRLLFSITVKGAWLERYGRRLTQ